MRFQTYRCICPLLIIITVLVGKDFCQCLWFFCFAGRIHLTMAKILLDRGNECQVTAVMWKKVKIKQTVGFFVNFLT
jgi:hypothetical protein